MIRMLLAGAAVFAVAGLAQASVAVSPVEVVASQIVEKHVKCKRGFRRNRADTRCVAIPRPSSGGGGGSSGGGSF
jgi:uncharacterized membrane protein YgcG